MADDSEKLANEFYRGTNTLGKETRLSLTGTEPSTPTGMAAGGVPAAATAGTAAPAGGAGRAIAGAQPGGSQLLQQIALGLKGAEAAGKIGNKSGGPAGPTAPSSMTLDPNGTGFPSFEESLGSADTIGASKLPGADTPLDKLPGGASYGDTVRDLTSHADILSSEGMPLNEGLAGIDPSWLSSLGESAPYIGTLLSLLNTWGGSGSTSDKLQSTGVTAGTLGLTAALAGLPAAGAGAAAAGGAAAGAAGAGAAGAGMGMAAAAGPAALMALPLALMMPVLMKSFFGYKGESKVIAAERMDQRRDGISSGAYGESKFGSDPTGLVQQMQSEITPDGLMRAIKGGRVNPGGMFGFTINGQQLSDMAYPEIVAALKGGARIAGSANTAGGESYTAVGKELAETLERQFALVSGIEAAGGENDPKAAPFVKMLRSQMENVDRRTVPGYIDTPEGTQEANPLLALIDRVKGGDTLGALTDPTDAYRFGVATAPDAFTYNDDLTYKATPGATSMIDGASTLGGVLEQLKAGGHLVGYDEQGHRGGFGTDVDTEHTRGLRYLSMLEEDRLRQLGGDASARSSAQQGGTAGVSVASPAGGAAPGGPSAGGMELGAPTATGTKFPWDEA